ncbi:DNA-3-methyladenine glycosylase I, partial [Klebsiella quasipneumoniae]
MHFFIIINATPEKSRIGIIAVFFWGIRFPCINYYLYLSVVKPGVHFFSAEGEIAMQRCGWVSQDPLYIEYHDTEWGVAQK